MLETISSSTRISQLFTHGERYTAHSIALLVEQRGNQHDLEGRVAFIAGKKLGNAVWRNQAKRRLRALCRDAGGPWAGYDVVFIARKDLLNDEYSKVLASTRKLIVRAIKET